MEPQAGSDEAREINTRFVRQLVAQAPALNSILEEHLRTYDEIIPYVFFYEVQDWCQREAESGLQSSDLETLLGDLDRAYLDESEPVRDMVALAFAEGIPRDSKLMSLLGPELKALALKF